MLPSREDPVLEGHLKANEAERRAFDDAAAPVLADLRAVGVKARSGADLVDVAHEPLPSKEAADVLRSWLTRVDDLGVKATIAQALSERQAGVETARVALSEIRKTPAGSSDESIVKERLAFCFEATATPALVKEIFDEIAELVRDPAHGDVRGLLLDMLPGFRHPGVEGLALEVLDDPQLRPDAIATLGRVAGTAAIPTLEKLLDDPKVGEYARLAIEDIRNRSTRA
jgi:hypothetical protein